MVYFSPSLIHEWQGSSEITKINGVVRFQRFPTVLGQKQKSRSSAIGMCGWYWWGVGQLFASTTTTTIVIFIVAILLFLFLFILVIIGSDIFVSSSFPNRTYKTKLIERERAHETSDNEDYNLIATFEGNEDINNMITIVMRTARQGTFPHVGKSSLVARGEVKPSALRDLRPTWPRLTALSQVFVIIIIVLVVVAIAAIIFIINTITKPCN